MLNDVQQIIIIIIRALVISGWFQSPLFLAEFLYLRFLSLLLSTELNKHYQIIKANENENKLWGPGSLPRGEGPWRFSPVHDSSRAWLTIPSSNALPRQKINPLSDQLQFSL